MRIKDSQEQLSYLKQACQLGNLELVYSGLDVLGATPWHINREVFNVVLEVWNSGKRLGKIPGAVLDQDMPEKPAEAEDDLRAKADYALKMKIWQLNRMNNHSKRCSVNYKIEIARAVCAPFVRSLARVLLFMVLQFLGETFFFPHNVDFRGRAYPIPPHLNHIGDDLSRGLLKFAESRPLGEKGLRWLKIHLANMYGFDKASFDERVAFTEQHLKEVIDSAENPLTVRPAVSSSMNGRLMQE